MACGVPVVTPRRGTYTEMVERTGGGVLVPPDDIDALVVALAALEADPARRVQLGTAGAVGVRSHYTAIGMAEAAIGTYQNLVGRTSLVDRPLAAVNN